VHRVILANKIATLMNDDTALQKLGAAKRFPEVVIEFLYHIEDACANGRLDQDTAARGREVSQSDRSLC
jgi:hypothetical protein